MKVVIQRTTAASVVVDGKTISSINKGLVILLGIFKDDTNIQMKYLMDKCINLRVFNDSNNKINLSLKDIEGEILLVSQFTLVSDCKKGRRPSFVNAAAPEKAYELYKETIAYLKSKSIRVKTGKFGANMAVSLVNDGPVTFILES